jgi:uncharacterized membrane-anchored protein
MTSRFAAAAAAFLLLSAAPAAMAAPASSEPAASSAAAPDSLDSEKGVTRFLESLKPQRGGIDLGGAGARLELGKGYYFLDGKDAGRVLTAWGNPKEASEGILGMIFPVGHTPLDDKIWGAVITYADTGYVSDKDARKTSYDDVLKQLREGEDDDNKEREKQNLKPIKLVGWGQPPSYDAARHTLIWARELQAGSEAEHVLNYDVRILGRKGVLSLNMVAGMSQLAEVRTAAADLQAVAAFRPGSRYIDFKEGTDKRAAYGLAGLILAGAGLAVAKKAGLIAIALLFLKKGVVVIAAGLAAIGAWFRKLFGGRKSA